MQENEVETTVQTDAPSENAGETTSRFKTPDELLKAYECLEKQQQDAYEKANGYTGEKARNFAERYNVALGFYTSLDPDVAVKALEASGTMKGYLGNNYEKLLSVLKSRATTKTKKYI